MEGYHKDNMVTCPYNKAHVVRAGRFVRHLIKCRKNNLLSKKVACPYNARHIIPRPEFEYHMQLCADRKFVEYTQAKEKAIELDCRKGDLTDPPYHQEEISKTFSDNWDADYKK